MNESFVTSPEKHQSFKHLGLNIVQKNDCIYLDQKLSIDELKEVGVDTKRKMCKEGQLTAKRSSSAIKLILYMQSDLLHTNRNIGLKAEQIALQYPNLGCMYNCLL